MPLRKSAITERPPRDPIINLGVLQSLETFEGTVHAGRERVIIYLNLAYIELRQHGDIADAEVVAVAHDIITGNFPCPQP